MGRSASHGNSSMCIRHEYLDWFGGSNLLEEGDTH